MDKWKDRFPGSLCDMIILRSKIVDADIWGVQAQPVPVNEPLYRDGKLIIGAL